MKTNPYRDLATTTCQDFCAGLEGGVLQVKPLPHDLKKGSAEAGAASKAATAPWGKRGLRRGEKMSIIALAASLTKMTTISPGSTKAIFIWQKMFFHFINNFPWLFGT